MESNGLCALLSGIGRTWNLGKQAATVQDNGVFAILQLDLLARLPRAVTQG
jgi:hypothetical protein